MQNRYLKFFIIILATAIIVPQVALAAWWNPFSWGVWNRVFHFKQVEQKQEQQQKQDQKAECQKDADCPTIYCIKAPCPQNKCVEGKCKLTDQASDKTANGWKTYSNRQYGFEFKYPSEWEISSYPILGQTTCKKIDKYSELPLFFHGKVSAGDTLSVSYICEKVSINDIKTTKTKVGGKDAYEYVTSIDRTDIGLGGFDVGNQIIIPVGDGTISINFFATFATGDPTMLNEDGSLTELGKQILSTFKFTNTMPTVGNDRDSHGCIGSAGYTWCEAKQKCLRQWEEKCEADETSSWKTYVSPLGYQIKYPADWSLNSQGIVRIYCDYAKRNNKPCSGAEQIPIADVGPSVTIETSGLSLDDYRKNWTMGNLEQTFLDGVPALKFNGQGVISMGIDNKVVLAQKNSNMFAVYYPDFNAPVLEKIASTFKFTK